MPKFRKLAFLDPHHQESKYRSRNIKTHAMADLENKMKEILYRDDLHPAKKQQQYNNELRHYLNYEQTHKLPSMSIIPSKSSASAHVQNDLEEELKLSLPKTYKSKGLAMLKHIRATPGISVSDNGELTYNGNIVAGSNVIDLINDALRKRKTALAPTGWQMFSNVLRHANIPRDFIGNTERYVNQPVKQLDYSDEDSDEETGSEDDDDDADDDDEKEIISPIKTIKFRKGNIQWTPYKK